MKIGIWRNCNATFHNHPLRQGLVHRRSRHHRTDEAIEVSEGVTDAEIILEIEVLGNAVRLSISANLSFVVDADLVRSIVAAHVMPEFARVVVDTISNCMIEIIGSDETKVTYKPRQASSLADLFGGATLLRVG